MNLQPKPIARRRVRELIVSGSIFQAQRKHFILLDVLPFLGIVASIFWFSHFSFTKIDASLFFFFLYVSGGGIELGFHRYFSHQSFQTSVWLQSLLAILGASSAQGPMLIWVANHRHHHKYSDQAGDSHSPQVKGFWHSYIFWKWNYPFPNPRYYCAKLLENPTLRKIDSYYYFWIVLFLAIPAIVGFLVDGGFEGAVSAFFAGGIIRMWVSQQVTWSINSIHHLFGSRRFETDEQSRNISVLAPVTLGVALHNNHHHDQNSGNNSRSFWEWDTGFWVLVTLEKLNLIWNLKRPQDRRLDQSIKGVVHELR